ncbi:MAG TPA: VOC family protein [Candidatus Limnocylindrales bacterium]|nr:VOC family protein [Candidatus Limnocylindrales bacterium]
MKLAQARLVTDNVPALARFYEEITRIAPIGSEDYVEFRTPGTTLAISSKRSIDLFSAGAAQPAANRSVVLDFEVEDVDKEWYWLRTKIPEFVLEPTDQPWGSRSMLFRDPDGNLINFFAPVRRTVTQ